MRRRRDPTGPPRDPRTVQARARDAPVGFIRPRRLSTPPHRRRRRRHRSRRRLIPQRLGATRTDSSSWRRSCSSPSTFRPSPRRDATAGWSSAGRAGALRAPARPQPIDGPADQISRGAGARRGRRAARRSTAWWSRGRGSAFATARAFAPADCTRDVCRLDQTTETDTVVKPSAASTPLRDRGAGLPSRRGGRPVPTARRRSALRRGRPRRRRSTR
jgi:hypothetical protein